MTPRTTHVLFVVLALATLFSAKATESADRRGSGTGDPATLARALSGSSQPLAFTENRGQWPDSVLFRAGTGGATFWFTSGAAYWQFARRLDRDPARQGTSALADGPDRQANDDSSVDGVAAQMIRAVFVAAAASPDVRGEGDLEYRCNYFLGNDPQRWVVDVPNYTSVVAKELYPGIDLKYYGRDGGMEYDFVVGPGADPSRIRIRYEGIRSLAVNAAGELVIETDLATMREHRPFAFQVRGTSNEEVQAEFVLTGPSTFGFRVSPGRDLSLPLVIDPVLSYSTYLGGSDGDEAAGIAVDGSGRAYVVGRTLSANFPTLNQFQTFQGGAGLYDIFITRLSAGGSSLEFSTYIGGSGTDYVYDIALDTSGQAFLTGSTASTNFPTQSPFQANRAGNNDVFVAKLSSAGNSLVYSTYLGGTASDAARGIALDGAGSAYVAGITASNNFPILNPYQTYQGTALYRDAFLTKLSAAGNSLVYSTYLGGTGWDEAWRVAVDDSGRACVTGSTLSLNFPTVNSYQADQGLGDAFLTKFTAQGSGVLFSTYLGGSDADEAHGIDLDQSGNIYVTGTTVSPDFPTQNPYSSYRAYSDVFLTKMSPTGAGLVYSTYLGGDSTEAAWDIEVDGSGSATVTGDTHSSDYPQQSSYQGNQGGQDAFVTRLSPAGNSLGFSTYLGGADGDYAFGIDADAEGSIYLVGGTLSTSFPTRNPYQANLGAAGVSDAFVTKMVECSIVMTGDVNTNGSITSADIIGMVNFVFKGGAHPQPCDAAGDVNCSGSVTSADIIGLVNFVFKGGAPPCDACTSSLASSC
jgi:hypothetical protein